MQVFARGLKTSAASSPARILVRRSAPRSAHVRHASLATSATDEAPSPYRKDFVGQISQIADKVSQAQKEQKLELLNALRARALENAAETQSKGKKAPLPKRAVKKAAPAKGRRPPKTNPFATSKNISAKARKPVATGNTQELHSEANGPILSATPDLQALEKFWIEGWGEDGLAASRHNPYYSDEDTPSQSHSTSQFRSGTFTPWVAGIIEPSEGEFHLYDLDPPTEQRPIPRLAHDLDRALFNPGVNWLQDPRSRVFNYSPWLENIPKVQDFDFGRVSGFIKSSKDEDLFRLAKSNGAKFAGSTSSLTGMLSHIYFALSNGKDVDTSVLSQAFSYEPKTFTPAQRFPTSTVLWYRNGIYSTDSYSYDPTSDKNVLTWMGTMLEKFLTMPEPAFKKLLRDSPAPATPVDQRRETCRYAKVGSYVMRSQLDCVDPRLPGTGVFDIKTRACLPVRLDVINYEENSGYLIRQMHGTLESFEREYYDLIRSAFLKYSFQARIGNMDGVFVAYHNTARIFGFQYVPLEEMDQRLFGNKKAGPYVFEKCVKLLEVISTEITSHYPEQHIACVWEADPENGAVCVWAEPLDWDGAPEDKPIVELKVRFEHFLDGKPIEGQKVIKRASEAPWTVTYTILQANDSPAATRARQQLALEKQRAVFNLPTGVSVDEMAARWEALDFGGEPAAARPKDTTTDGTTTDTSNSTSNSTPDGTATGTENATASGTAKDTADATAKATAHRTPFAPERFRAPTPAIRKLRALAQRGRVHVEREAARRAHAPPVVWAPAADAGAFFDGGAAQEGDAQEGEGAPADAVIATLAGIAQATARQRAGRHEQPPRSPLAELLAAAAGGPAPKTSPDAAAGRSEPVKAAPDAASGLDESATGEPTVAETQKCAPPSAPNRKARRAARRAEREREAALQTVLRLAGGGEEEASGLGETAAGEAEGAPPPPNSRARRAAQRAEREGEAALRTIRLTGGDKDEAGAKDEALREARSVLHQVLESQRKLPHESAGPTGAAKDADVAQGPAAEERQAAGDSAEAHRVARSVLDRRRAREEEALRAAQSVRDQVLATQHGVHESPTPPGAAEVAEDADAAQVPSEQNMAREVSVPTQSPLRDTELQSTDGRQLAEGSASTSSVESSAEIHPAEAAASDPHASQPTQDAAPSSEETQTQDTSAADAPSTPSDADSSKN